MQLRNEQKRLENERIEQEKREQEELEFLILREQIEGKNPAIGAQLRIHKIMKEVMSKLFVISTKILDSDKCGIKDFMDAAKILKNITAEIMTIADTYVITLNACQRVL